MRANWKWMKINHWPREVTNNKYAIIDSSYHTLTSNRRTSPAWAKFSNMPPLVRQPATDQQAYSIQREWKRSIGCPWLGRNDDPRLELWSLQSVFFYIKWICCFEWMPEVYICRRLIAHFPISPPDTPTSSPDSPPFRFFSSLERLLSSVCSTY